LQLGDYYLFHAVRADLLRQLGRNVEAKRAYDAAIARCDNIAEQNFLRRRRQTLEAP
jgi:RNA polymerase sigma-70 factor (ECF subfamily)